MSKHHSTVSRRDFMKGLGLAGAGLGAAAAAAPVFHDLDEVIASPNSQRNRPWYVKDVDEPTLEVDWNLMQRFPASIEGVDNYLVDHHDGWAEKIAEAGKTGAEFNKQAMLQDSPGLTLRDNALTSGAWPNVATEGMAHLLPPIYAATPEQRGVPKWQGTPEESAGMIRVASRLYGAQDVGFLKIDERIRKLFWSWVMSTINSKKLVFEDVDQAYIGTENVIPNKCQWIIVFIGPQSVDLTSRFSGAPNLGYEMMQRTQFRLQHFLKGLGYQAVGGDAAGIGSAPASGVMSGAAELGRNNIMITPETGSCIRSAFWIVTDLPLATTKPIDFGARRFCYDCRACQLACPAGAFDDEREPSWGQEKLEGPWRWPGARRWLYHQKKCFAVMAAGCATCQASCVFSKKGSASIHEVTKAIVSVTPILNSFFTTMDRAFGYGMYDNPEEFWEINDYPLFGLH